MEQHRKKLERTFTVQLSESHRGFKSRPPQPILNCAHNRAVGLIIRRLPGACRTVGSNTGSATDFK